MAPTPTALNPSTPTHDTAQAGHARNRVALEEDRPWRYIGYRGYSKFISSDSDFLLLRRFRALNVRVGLALQHQLVELERDLEELDRSCGRAAVPITRLDDKDELIYLVQKYKTPLRHVIDNSTFLRTLWLWRTKKGAEPGYAADAVSYYSDKKMDRFVSLQRRCWRAHAPGTTMDTTRTAEPPRQTDSHHRLRLCVSAGPVICNDLEAV
ncbi:phytase [Fusarium mexicanum]|uniref:Phytase n=1 Tax=Fusarium mexicanum TaxID=751941 RepID=A0A8H5ID27_9HYPO|nr:phytase [Fusarium mexicanum]